MFTRQGTEELRYSDASQRPAAVESRSHTEAGETQGGGDVMNEPRSQSHLTGVGTRVGQSMGRRIQEGHTTTAKEAASHEAGGKSPSFSLQPPDSAFHWPVPAGGPGSVAGRRWPLQGAQQRKGSIRPKGRRLKASRPRAHMVPQLHQTTTVLNSKKSLACNLLCCGASSPHFSL